MENNVKYPIQHIMLDIETLGTKPGCPIIQIAAVGFSLKHDTVHSFNRIVQLEEAELAGIEGSTLVWWLSTDDRASQLNTLIRIGKSTAPIGQALLEFAEWLSRYQEEGKEAEIWGNGATFDNTIIAAESVACLGAPLWNFRKDRCYRTVRAMFKDLIPEPEFVGIKHNALDDAAHQARYLKTILCYIRDVGIFTKELQSQ